MRLREKIDIGYKIIRGRLTNTRVPLVVGWSLTNRCNLNCVYCGRWSSEVEELETSDIFSIIDELKTLGTKMISFTGGEPLLRDDIGDIIDYTHKSGMYVNMNTNGILFVKKINELSNLHSVRFSLDGTEDINDDIRGRGTYEKVIEAIKIAKSKGMKVFIITTLSKYNLSTIDYLINLAENLEITIIFQPLTLALLDSKVANPHIPDTRKYKNTIDRLIEYRKKNKPIFNTVKGLIYLRNWPEGNNIFCYGRNITCRIKTDGYLYHCGRREDKDMAFNCLNDGVKKGFGSLAPVSCDHCWCALRLETNYIASLSPSVIFSVFKKL